MSFLDEIKAVIASDYQYTYTENGAKVYSTSGSKLVDLNYSVSSLRRATVSDIIGKFSCVLAENELLAIKWLFYIGDVRGGLGERRLFKICFYYLAEVRPDVARKLLKLIAHYTRFDNLFVLLSGKLKDDVCDIVRNQLTADLSAMKEGKKVSLLAKWLPSVQTCNEERQYYLSIILKALCMTKSEYRKKLAALRKYMKVVERLMSDGLWSEIEYSSVPSKANLLYAGAFKRHDVERRAEFLTRVKEGEEDIHAGVLFPHDIISRYAVENGLYFSRFYPTMPECDETYEELWKALPDYVNGADSTLCVTDGSGSMYSKVDNKGCLSAIDVAISLTIYFAERCGGEFKDKYITFSNKPQFVDFSGAKSLQEKVIIASNHNEVADTNIEAVFDLVLKAAIRSKGENLPKNILILSDMEFNDCVVCGDGTQPLTDDSPLFDVIAKKYADAGITMPRLVFWNICSRTCGVPVRENAKGLAFVSGFSPSVCQMVLSDELDPLKCLLDVLNGERYNLVEQALSE